MNILILTDTFSKGGLETHIDTMYNELKKNNNIFFAFSNYEKNNYLKDATIYTKFKFSYESTIRDFCEDVNKLVKIIKKHHIDLIHVHPFYCLFPSIFAANITNTKIVYTYHGRTSLNFVRSINDDIIYEFAIENILNKVFCVTNNAVEWYKDYKKEEQCVYFPNLIDEEKYVEHKVLTNKRWALISRIDNDKDKEIKKIIRMLPELDIETIDIYGTGNEIKNIERLVKKLNLQEKVIFKGYNYNIYEKLNNNYNGVIGIGRVAIEALTMNYPVLLIGHGKVCGVINEKIFNNINTINFVNTETSEVNIKELNQQLKDLNSNINLYQFRNKMIKLFGKGKIKDYIDEIENISYNKIVLLDKVYENIKTIKDLEEKFYNSNAVFEELRNLVDYSKNINLKSKFNTFVELHKQQYEIKLLKNNIISLENKIYFLEKERNENLQRFNNLNNIGLVTLIKRDIKKIINKLKNKCYKK